MLRATRRFPRFFSTHPFRSSFYMKANRHGQGARLHANNRYKKNEYFDIPEYWAAFVGADGVGVGVCVPSARQITCYRFQGGADSDCSYLTPITTFGFRPGMRFEYAAYFSIGNAEELRARIERLAKPPATEPKPATRSRD